MPLLVLQPCSNLCSSGPLGLQKPLALQLGSARASTVPSLVLRGFTAQLVPLHSKLLLALLTLEKVEKQKKKPQQITHKRLGVGTQATKTD